MNNPDGDDPERGNCTQAGHPTPAWRSSAPTPTATTAASGAARAPARGGPAPGRRLRPGLPRRRPLLRARDPERPRAGLGPPGHHADHQPHLLQPGPAPAGHPVPRARRRTRPIYKALGDSMAAEQRLRQPEELPALRHHRRHRGLDLLRHRRPGLHVRDRPARLPPASTRDVSPSTRAPPRRRATGGGNRAAYFKALENTADSSKHSTLTGKAPAGAVLRLKKSFTTVTSPVIDADGIEGARAELPRHAGLHDDGHASTATSVGHQPVHAAGRGRRPAGRAATGPPERRAVTFRDHGRRPGPPCGATSQAGR